MQWLRSRTLNKNIIWWRCGGSGSKLASLHFYRLTLTMELDKILRQMNVRFCFIFEFSERYSATSLKFYQLLLNVISPLEVFEYLLFVNCITQLLTTKFYCYYSSVLLHLIFTKIKMQQVQWVFFQLCPKLSFIYINW